MEGTKGLLNGEVLSGEGIWSLDRGGGCGKAAKSEVTQGKQMESCFFLGPSTGTHTEGAQRHLKTPKKMLLHNVCGHLAAAKSSVVQQVPGLING